MPQPPRKRLPANPSIEHLRKQAKRRAKSDPSIQLADAQHELAREYGCPSWAELMRLVETISRSYAQRGSVSGDGEPLPAVARRRDIDAVRRILGSGQYESHDLDRALAHAAWYGGDAPDILAARKQIFDLVLEHGADPDAEYGGNYGPIVFGCGECLSAEGLQWLLNAGADVTFQPVQTKYGVQCPLSYVLGTYARSSDNRSKHRLIEMLLARGAFVPPEVSPPILAIHRGVASELSALIDREPDLPRRTFRDMPYGNMLLAGGTLLHCAVEFGEISCIDLLIARGADVNAAADVIDGVGGQTPIYHAIASNIGGNFHTLEHLVRRYGGSIDPDVRATFRLSDGYTQESPVTPREFAEQAMREETPNWRWSSEREIALLLSLR
jgi:hypothetical protein